MNLNEIPTEVMWAKSLLSSPGVFYVGSEMYNKIMDIKKKYPEHFPWETTYDKLPKGVHKDYRHRLEKLHDEIFPKKEETEQEKQRPNEGMFSYISRQKPYTGLTKEGFDEIIQYLFVEHPQKQRKFEEEKRTLWNKIYGKYKLEYREKDS